jgi:hypothetical protein
VHSPRVNSKGGSAAHCRRCRACSIRPKLEADVLAENADLGGRITGAVGCRDRPRRVYRGSYPLGVAEAGYPGYSNAGRDAALRQELYRKSIGGPPSDPGARPSCPLRPNPLVFTRAPTIGIHKDMVLEGCSLLWAVARDASTLHRKRRVRGVHAAAGMEHEDCSLQRGNCANALSSEVHRCYGLQWPIRKH